jgi:hypothetical protein
MCSLTQRLRDLFPTVRTILSGVMGRYSNCRHPKHLAEIFQPVTEVRPCSIRDRLSEFLIPDHVPYLQVFIGNQVVRQDDASCQLHGKIFTLPTYFEVRPTQAIYALSSVLRTLLGSGHLATKTLECFLGLFKMARVLDCLTIGGVSLPQLKKAVLEGQGFKPIVLVTWTEFSMTTLATPSGLWFFYALPSLHFSSSCLCYLLKSGSRC